MATKLEKMESNLDKRLWTWFLRNFENDLENLYTDVRTWLLSKELLTINQPEKWKFLNGHESRDKNFMVYEYTIKSGGKPEDVRKQAVKQWLVSEKEWIEITDWSTHPYSDDKRFNKWDKVYVRIPKEKLIVWEFVKWHESRDKNFMVYEYWIMVGWTPASVRQKAVDKWIAEKITWIQITDGNVVEYPEDHKFSAWDKVYVRVPKKMEQQAEQPTETTTETLTETPTENQGEEQVEQQAEQPGQWDTEITEDITMENHWENPDFFDASKKVETDEQYKNKWIILKRDVWMSFYVMQKSDIQDYTEKKVKNWKTKKETTIVSGNRVKTINYLREKLWALPEFSYLKRDEYAPKQVGGKRVFTKTFNIRTDFAAQTVDHPGKFFIPIPLDSSIRKIDDQTFKNYAKDWVNELCQNDEPYWKYWKWFDESQLARFLTAIAKVETWETSHEIWTDEYHRWEEGSHDCFSFWPHHVLMEWPWKTAYNKLKQASFFSTEWQTYHPKNSTMWCMWFIVEKLINTWTKPENVKAQLEEMLSFLSKNEITWDDVKLFAKKYNWKNYVANKYHTKFATAWNNL